MNKKYYDDVWARFIQQRTREVVDLERDIEDVRNRMYAALKKEGDKPSTIEDQLLWLLDLTELLDPSKGTRILSSNEINSSTQYL